MCLYTNNKQTYIAKKDMICYKICIKKDDIYYSFFRSYQYELNKIVSSKISIIEYTFSTYKYHVEEGLHSFQYLKDAEDYLKIIKRDHKHLKSIKFIILKCIIPKDSVFIDGLYIEANGIIYKNYVSNTLLPIEEIK